jgi:hypothetical protein
MCPALDFCVVGGYLTKKVAHPTDNLLKCSHPWQRCGVSSEGCLDEGF